MRWLQSPDLSDLEHGTPANPECFCLLVQAMIGEHGTAGSEAFSFLVCTAQWLAREVAEIGERRQTVHLHGVLRLRAPAAHLCDGAEGPDWETVAAKLGRYSLCDREALQDLTQGPAMVEGTRPRR